MHHIKTVNLNYFSIHNFIFSKYWNIWFFWGTFYEKPLKYLPDYLILNDSHQHSIAIRPGRAWRYLFFHVNGFLWMTLFYFLKNWWSDKHLSHQCWKKACKLTLHILTYVFEKEKLFLDCKKMKIKVFLQWNIF